MRVLGYPGGTSIIITVLIRGRQGRQIDRRQEGDKRQISRWNPALWRKKPGTKDATPEAGRGSDMDSPKSCRHPDFSPVRPVSDFSPPEPEGSKRVLFWGHWVQQPRKLM